MARKSRRQPLKAAAVNVRSAVGYIRVSVANKDESGSVENQQSIIERWAMEHKLPINHFYIDENCSGSNFERPAFKQMLEDIDTGRIGCIVVKDLSRVGREFLSTSYYIEEYFPSKKVLFISVNDHLKRLMVSTIWSKKLHHGFEFRLSMLSMSKFLWICRRKRNPLWI